MLICLYFGVIVHHTFISYPTRLVKSLVPGPMFWLTQLKEVARVQEEVVSKSTICITVIQTKGNQ